MNKITNILLLFPVMLFSLTMNLYSQPSSETDLKSSVDISNFDLTVNPNTDFYFYVNGNWLKNNPVPPEYTRWGSSNTVIESNIKTLHQILEDAKNSNSPEGTTLQKIGDLYFTAMDTAKIEVEGFNPIKEDLAAIDAINSKEDFIKVFSYLKTFRNGGIFSVFAGQDDKNSENVILQLFQSGLGLPERDYYLKDDDKSKKLRLQYGEHISKMFELTGTDNLTSDKIARSIIALETRLAKASMTRIEMRDPDATYHKYTLNELKSLTPDFNWDVFFDAMWLSDKSKFDNGIIVGQPEFFKEVNSMLTDVSISDWKNYLKWNLLRSSADKLSSDFANENFRFYGTILRGTQEQFPRWRKSLNFVESAMAEPLGQLFVEIKFKPEAKAKVLEMVNNLMEALRERILNLEWMSDSTKQAALRKLGKITVKIGYPDKWKDYSSLEINRTSFAQNIKRAAVFGVKRNIDKIGNPVDKAEWGFSPQTVNASYSPSKNEITFPAGILQPPFYDSEADEALNYGGIGAIIGHELTHGFDDSGRKYDADGNLVDWWTKEDADNFKMRSDKLVEQFNEYIAIDSVHVKGELTLGENIADLGGLKISYDALQKVLTGKEIILIDGFTPEQRFFINYAQIWRNNSRPESIKLLINTDPHSPGHFRVIGPLSNMQEFQKAFNGAEGEPMVRPSDVRVVIW